MAVLVVVGGEPVVEFEDSDDRGYLGAQFGVKRGLSRRARQHADQSAFLMACNDELLTSGFRADRTMGAVWFT